MNDIESYLPHRPPFLFVDDVYIKDDTIFAEHTFHAEDWFFKGHFPEFPIVPGVLLVESMAQAGGVGAKLMGIYPISLFMLAKIKEARFKQPVRPGDTIKMEITNVRASTVYLHQRGIGKVGDTIVTEAEWISIASGVPE
ncbi:3-hydroxyacyl-(acyl-carrier-protein) dehydratase FabZ [uncultured spirochete]|uniref:3-hydroxyacyl-(Acyl-carrier-protein) dehydratase FabZ n=1 Tax=uncultured spirochete TaxID=156406 RepID=A0A3P3XUC6_9SPIR|nr:3-hydroxyacyl-(acyl-carrier-protein) dehydratase FabZ [uncultured spirochete]